MQLASAFNKSFGLCVCRFSRCGAPSNRQVFACMFWSNSRLSIVEIYYFDQARDFCAYPTREGALTVSFLMLSMQKMNETLSFRFPK